MHHAAGRKDRSYEEAIEEVKEVSARIVGQGGAPHDGCCPWFLP